MRRAPRCWWSAPSSTQRSAQQQQRGHAQRRRDLVLQVLAVADDVLRRGRRGAGELLVLGQRQQVGAERVAGRAVALLERPRADGAGAADLRGQLLQPPLSASMRCDTRSPVPSARNMLRSLSAVAEASVVGAPPP